MSADEQRIAIAEACGWKWCHYYNPHEVLIEAPKGYSTEKWTTKDANNRVIWPLGKQTIEQIRLDVGLLEALPDYLNSLDAMHEAEKVLRAQKYAYALFCHELLKITNPGADRLAREWSADEWENAISATAAQRAEAFLQTINPPTK